MKKFLFYAIMVLAVMACSDQNAPTNARNGALPGKFSVSATKQVQFAQGNLQYQPSSNTWRFAEHQYDLILDDNTYISRSYTGWIDLFGWGTGDNPLNVSTTKADYTYFVDWGMNPISNGGNTAHTWSTLTDLEWLYLFHDRTNADKLFGFGTVKGIKGVILLPDDWSASGIMGFTPTPLSWDVHNYQPSSVLTWNGTSYVIVEKGDDFTLNTYTTEEWTQMESMGAVFLPMSGYRLGLNLYETTNQGSYWSAKPKDSGYGYCLYFTYSNLYPYTALSRSAGCCVRLVK